jgi:hypothetical protein
LKILKDEKINLADVIITEEKINLEDLEREYASIAFDESIRIRYLYRIKNVLQNRTALFNRLNANSAITDKHLEQFQKYFVEAHALKSIKQVNQLPEIAEQINLFQSTVCLITPYLEAKHR